MMCVIRSILTFILMNSVLLLVAAQKREGDYCISQHANNIGRCAPADQCLSARDDFRKNGIRPTFCEYSSESVLVCCRDGTSILDQASPERNPENRPVWGSSSSSGNNNWEGVKRVSERKCTEYSRSVTQSVEFVPLLPDPEQMSVTTPKCNYAGVELIVGGETAGLGEFPHMALLGWATFEGGYSFICGGSLISPKYVLTAAHCTSTRDSKLRDETPVVVRLGDKNIDAYVDDGARPVEVAIRRIISHPNYKSPVRYNDIALVELATNVDFDSNIRPACLWSGGSYGQQKAIATGWGVSDLEKRISSSELQKVSLDILNNNYCDRLLYKYRNRLWMGFSNSQICAGDLRGGKDTCQGDSGGPLQIHSKENPCIFHVIGVTSFGHKCGKSGVPAVYTKVASYLDWIESVVWPGE